MDFRTFKTSDWLMIGGSLGVLVFGLLPWSSTVGIRSLNALDFTFTGALPWLLVVAGGTIAALIAARVIVDAGDERLQIALVGLFSTGAVLMLVRLAIGPEICESIGDQRFCATFDRGIGLFASALAAVIGCLGAVINLRSAGRGVSAMQQRAGRRSSGGGADDGDADPTNEPAERAAELRRPPPAQFGRTPPPPPPPPPPSPSRGQPPPPLPRDET